MGFSNAGSVTTTTSTSLSTSLPTYSAGDILVMMVNGGYLACTSVSGWTRLGTTISASNTSQGSNIPRVDMDLFWKVAGSSESAPTLSLSSIGSFSQFQRATCRIFSFTGYSGVEAETDGLSVTSTSNGATIVQAIAGGGSSYTGSGNFISGFSGTITMTDVSDTAALIVTGSGQASYAIGLGTGTQTSAGSTGTITPSFNTVSAATAYAEKTFALTVPPPRKKVRWASFL